MSTVRWDWTSLDDHLPPPELVRTLNVRMPRLQRSVSWIVNIGQSGVFALPTLVLYQNGGLSTNNTVDVSLATYTLPASALAVSGDAVRINIVGRATGFPGTPIVKFGATSVLTHGVNNTLFTAMTTVTRLSATTQTYGGMLNDGAAVSSYGFGSGTAPTETLTSTVVIDFRGSIANAAGLFTYDSVTVELLRGS